MCLQGASRVAAVLREFPAGSLRILIAWVPMLPPDDAGVAETAARNFPDAVHFWDGHRTLASQLGKSLGITSAQAIGAPGPHGLAWDVYLAYRRGAVWGEPPDFWMHQLAVTHAPRLDPAEFGRRVERLLST